MLCAVSQVTDIIKALSFVENNAFLNIEERKLYSQPLIKGDRNTISSKIKLTNITEDFMIKSSKCAELDSNAIYKDFTQTSLNVKLATPRHICTKYRRKKYRIQELEEFYVNCMQLQL